MKNKKQLIALSCVSLLLIASIILGLGKPYFQQSQNKDHLNSDGTTSSQQDRLPVPNFTFWDMDKNDVEFQDFIGKPIVINFWATWCGYCVIEMPDFDRLIGEYQEDVSFIMLDAYDGKRETEKEVNAFLETQQFEHLVPYLDGYKQGLQTFGIRSFPTTVFIDAEGKLYDAILGMTDYDTVKSILDKELTS